MYTVSAASAPNNYPIYIGTDLLSNLNSNIKQRKLIIIDKNVYPYIDKMLSVNRISATEIYILKADEQSKNWSTVSKILDELILRRYDRASCLVSIGGGVINDLVGFAASIYQRGIDWHTMPTTLLAQVDASVGGKTGCNYAGFKNQIGCFFQPKSVIIDLGLLSSLPEREYIAGLAEVVKYGMVKDADFFAWLEVNADAILSRDKAVLQTIIKRCCVIKREVVAEDVRDRGVRMVLNFGHTFAHAIESATHFQEFLHGEAVALGMLLATRVAVVKNIVTDDVYIRLSMLLDRLGLPIDTGVLSSSINSVCDFLFRDKKVYNGQLILILPLHVGEVKVVDNVAPELIKDCITNYVSI